MKRLDQFSGGLGMKIQQSSRVKVTQLETMERPRGGVSASQKLGLPRGC